MKMVFVSSYFGGISGAHTNMLMHYNTLISILGKDNIFTVDLLSNGKEIKTKYSWYNEKNKNIEKNTKSVLTKIKNIYPYSLKINSSENIKAVLNAIKKISANSVYIEESLCGGIVRAIKLHYPNVSVITFFTDVKKYLYLQWLKQKGIAFLPEYIAGLHFEKINSRYTDYTITLNRRETFLLKNYYGIDASLELPVGVKTPDIRFIQIKKRKKSDKLNLLFVGARYYPNIEAVQWFVHDVFSAVKDYCNFTVIGRGMEYLRNEIKTEGVKIVGSVDFLEEYYANADVIILPVFSGGGMKVKTAEALSFGKAILASEESLIGYKEILPENCKEIIIQCDTKEEYIYNIKNMFKNLSDKYHSESYNFYEQHFSEIAIYRSLKALIEKCEI